MLAWGFRLVLSSPRKFGYYLDPINFGKLVMGQSDLTVDNACCWKKGHTARLCLQPTPALNVAAGMPARPPAGPRLPDRKSGIFLCIAPCHCGDWSALDSFVTGTSSPLRKSLILILFEVPARCCQEDSQGKHAMPKGEKLRGHVPRAQVSTTMYMPAQCDRESGN